MAWRNTNSSLRVREEHPPTKPSPTLTWIPSITNFFPFYTQLASVQHARSTSRHYFAIDFTYGLETGELVVGNNQTFNLNTLTTSTSLPLTSAPFVVSVKTGDHDGINLPWFTIADATLLFWEIHGDFAEVPLRLRVTNTSEINVQVWPDSDGWVGRVAHCDWTPPSPPLSIANKSFSPGSVP